MYNDLETVAKAARDANSFRGYESGSATAELNDYITKAEETAADAIKRLESENAPQERIDKVNFLLERYKTKIKSWLIDYYNCEASCPSIMICGGSNFPTRKKERQNARRERIQENSPEYILNKIEKIAYNAGTIYSDDKNAVERLKEKIKAEEEAHEYAKRANAYYNKNKTLKGFENITDEQAEKIESHKYWERWQPFSTLNNTANIRRLKERLLELDPDSVKANKKITVNGKEATYKNIISLFDSVKPDKSIYGGDDFYINIPLVFSDGKRNYKQFLQIITDESGETFRTYGYAANNYQYIFLPLTDERKFKLIINKISGSGNKAVIYSILKDLAPKPETKQDESKSKNGTINGEGVTIERNNELMRLQIFFDGIPQPETRQKMKANGFRWSPKNKAWQRLLNNNSEYALKRILN